MNRQTLPIDRIRRTAGRLSGTCLITVVAVLAAGASADTTGTLTLDSLSFISFEDQQTFSLPSGSTLQFQFGTPTASGTIPFTIAPGGTCQRR